MNARYAYGGVAQGGSKRVDSGFQSVSARRLTAALGPLIKNGGFITIIERGMIMHLYFTHGLASIEYHPLRSASSSFSGPIALDQLPQLLQLFEDGLDPSAFVEALPRVQRTTAT